MSFNTDELSMSFRNLALSYRGSERQAPSTLQLALRFSRAVEIHQQNGTHPSGWTLEERLRDVVDRFHLASGVTAKHRIDEEKMRALLNLISGTHEGARKVIALHLNHAKWKESAFSAEQFKSVRWILGSSPKMAGCEMKKCLTVTEEAQTMHLQLVVQTFIEAGRKVRPSSRTRLRLSQEMFDKYCDYACMFASVLQEARLLTTWTQEKEAEIKKLFLQRYLGVQFQQESVLFGDVKPEDFFVFVFFLQNSELLRDYFAEVEAATTSKLTTWQLKHLSVWGDYVEPTVSAVLVPDNEEIAAMEDATQAVRFREVKAKVAKDVAAMTAFNAKVKENKNRLHIVTVMHEKGQIQVGRQFFGKRCCKFCCNGKLIKTILKKHFRSILIPQHF